MEQTAVGVGQDEPEKKARFCAELKSRITTVSTPKSTLASRKAMPSLFIHPTQLTTALLWRRNRSLSTKLRRAGLSLTPFRGTFLVSFVSYPGLKTEIYP